MINNNNLRIITIITTSLTLTTLFFIAKPVFASDNDNLYDTCPTDTSRQHTIFINGLPCKNPSDITASDFKSSILNESGNTSNFYLSSTVIATASSFPGLNTLGLSAARTDIEVDGTVMPHVHPRASEVVFIKNGVVVAGFIDSSSRVFQKRLREGEVFVFPKGLLHFCFNGGFDRATVFSVLNSQNPGTVRVSDAMFGLGDEVSGVMMMMKKMKALAMEDVDGVSVVDLLGSKGSVLKSET